MLPGCPAPLGRSSAFAEEGTPSLREVLESLIAAGVATVLIVPIALPAEPGFVTGLKKALQRWRGSDRRPWPEIRIAPFPDRDLLDAVVRAPDAQAVTLGPEAPPAEGSIVPAQKRLGLRTAGEGT